MNFGMKTKLKMNQNNGNNQAPGGSGGSTTPQATPQGTSTPQAPGSNTPPGQAAAPGAEAQKPVDESLGYEGAEDVTVGDYGADGLKAKLPKPQDEIKLGYELENVEGFSDEEVLGIKQFAAKNKLSKEAAKDFIESKRADAQKFHEILENQKVQYAEKVKNYKQAEFQKLKAEIGGEGGKDFKANLKKISDFLAQNLPELKKEIDEKGVFLSASVMKSIFNLQNKLLKEEPLVNGGAAGGDDKNQPVWMRRYK